MQLVVFMGLTASAPTLPFYKSLDTATSSKDRPKYKTKQCRLSLGIRSRGGGYFVAMSVASESENTGEQKNEEIEGIRTYIHTYIEEYETWQ